MQLDPSESLNNMGTLRVDVLDGADLPAADRNGFSDPYCKFELNGESVFKTKVQKKTLHPAWNEYFEVNIPSRTAAKFSVRVMDWDFGDKADFLGAADINLNMLEPMQAREITLTLDGKSGVIRLKLLFKPAYVTRSRQGSSTFSGTIGPGKVISAPVRGVSKVGGGMVKGASFIKHSFRKTPTSQAGDSGKDHSPVPSVAFANGVADLQPAFEAQSQSSQPFQPFQPRETFQPREPFQPRAVSRGNAPGSPSAPPPAPFLPSPHGRAASFTSASMPRMDGAAGGGGVGSGTANFTVVSATGYPSQAKLQVHIRQLTGAKGSHKDILRTKGVKSSTGTCVFGDESAKVSCAPDAQFTLVVKDDRIFGDVTLGEALFFVDDSGTGSERAVKAGEGSVVVRSSFTPGESAGPASPNFRRSFLGKREVSRGGTPNREG